MHRQGRLGAIPCLRHRTCARPRLRLPPSEGFAAQLRGLRGAQERSGQATVEAAFLIPVAMVAILLVLQPAIVLYDRAVMLAAASEGCRLLETRASQSDDEVRAFVERRLEAVPDAPPFHTGAWDIRIEGAEGFDWASVSISHELEPLPLIGAALGFAGLTGEGGRYRQEVECGAAVCDEWLAASGPGRDPAAWISRWNDKV